MNLKGITSLKVVGELPLAIPTSIALETFFLKDKSQQDKTKAYHDISYYKTAYINVWTLIRNILSAIGGNDIRYDNSLTPILTEMLAEEIRIILGLFKELAPNTSPFFFTSTYSQVLTDNKLVGRLRVTTSEKQKAINKITLQVIKDVVNQFTILQTNDLVPVNNRMTGIMLSHIAYDLLAYSNFQDLHLLESHTGVIKRRHEWNTKYVKIPKEDMSRLPFNKTLLMNFGDSILIKPIAIKDRKAIIQLGKSRKWQPLMSEQKVITDMKIHLGKIT